MAELTPGQVAVVTGAGSGIGQALARAFAVRGLDLAIADVDPGRLNETRESLSGSGVQVLTVPTDVTSSASVEHLAAATRERFGTFDIVCNNVGGAIGYRSFWEITVDEWQRLFSLNVWSVIYGIRAFVPHLVEKNSGHVLNTASMAGLTIIPRIADYIVTKSTVVSLTETLRADLDVSAPGVGATALCPGFARTPMGLEMGAKLQIERQRGLTAQATGGAVVPNDSALEPDDIAASALAAIEANLLYVAPSANPLSRIRPKVERLLSEISEPV